MTDRTPIESAQTRFGEGPVRRGPGSGFGLTNALIGIGVLVAVVAVLLWSAVAGQATPARHPQLFGGSIVLDDRRPPVVLDLATAAVTVRLQDVFAQVDATRYADVQAVPFDGGTMLVNRLTGNFNVLGKDNFVLKRSGGGVGLGSLAGSTGAMAIAAGSSAFIVRYAPQSTVSLVGRDTVQAVVRLSQPGTTRTVPPRGFTSLKGPVPNQPGATAVAGKDLWLLVDNNGQRDLVRLDPQTASHNGLAVTEEGAVGSSATPAALESAAGGVALASPGRVRLYSPRSKGHRDVNLPATKNATAIMPISGTKEGWWFLARDDAGWSVVGVNANGRVLAPQSLRGLAAGVQPVTPVLSAGQLYTMDRAAGSQPALWRIDPQKGAVTTVAGATSYPTADAAERADFSDAEVVASGPRVIFNNPDSLLGVVVFTDGSHPPVVIDKSTAVNVSAVGPSSGKRQASDNPAAVASGSEATVPPAVHPAAPQVSQQVTCANTTQKPRSPQVTQTVPSAHSVLVTWSYPLLDNQDCQPDTWTVRLQAFGAPQPAQPLQTVTGQSQLQFNGLRPSVNYQVVVTAYIKQQATASAPVPFTTLPSGPDAPTSVQTASDGNGHWIVSWTPCTAANCYVPAATWTVTGASCGGFVGQPPIIQMPGDQTTVTIDAATAHLLGAFMTFQVQGISGTGLTGDPFADHACTQAWRPPDPAHIALKASAIPSGQSVTATLVVTTDEDPATAFGSNATELIYQVGNQTVGPTSALSATVNGLTPGQQYQTSVTVRPKGHTQAAATVNGPPISQNLQWPANLAMSAAATVSATDPNSGMLTATFSNLPQVPLSGSGTIQCGSSVFPVGGALPGSQLSFPIGVVTIGGSCTLNMQLSETKTGLYGVASQNLHAPFTVPGTQPDRSSFTAVYDNSKPLDERVIVNGQTGNKGADWSLKMTGPFLCSSEVTSPNPLTFPLTIHLYGCNLGQPVTLQISWTYLGARIQFPITPSGTPVPTTTTTSSTTTSSTTSTTKPTTTTTKKAAPAAPVGLRGEQTPRTVLAGQRVALSGQPGDRRAGALVLDLTLIGAMTGMIAIAVNVRRSRRRRSR